MNELLVQMARLVAYIFYLIGIIGGVVLLGAFGDVNYGMEAFLGIESFDSVTNLIILAFFLANISIGLIIHLLSGILDEVINKKSILSSNKTGAQFNNDNQLEDEVASESTNRKSIQTSNFGILNKTLFKIQQTIKQLLSR